MAADPLDELHHLDLHGSRSTVHQRHPRQGTSVDRNLLSIPGVLVERSAATGAHSAVSHGVQKESLERALPSTQHSQLESFGELAAVGETARRTVAAHAVDPRSLRRTCSNLRLLDERTAGHTRCEFNCWRLQKIFKFF